MVPEVREQESNIKKSLFYLSSLGVVGYEMRIHATVYRGDNADALLVQSVGHSLCRFH